MDDLKLFSSLNSDFKKSLKEDADPRHSWSFKQKTLMRIKMNRCLPISLFILAGLFFFALFGPFFSSMNYDETNPALKNLPPDLRFWFGTDELGRDLFVRCCMGARISLVVASAASIIDLVIGVAYGLTAGYANRKIANPMMRFLDILQSIPYLPVVILLIVVMGPGLITIIIALAITGWINMARIVRAQVLQLKSKEFILAAEGYGASTTRILMRYILPNIRGTIIVVLMATIPTALFTEAFLSFLGLGIQAPVASWGTLANDGLAALRFYPWRLFFPSICIFLSIFCLNIVGDGLRDAFEERSRL